MIKGSDFDFIGLYTAILDDIRMYFPNDRVEWDRDLKRLISLYEHQGKAVFTIDLPALGKILDRSLADGLLRFQGTVNHSGPRHRKSEIPRLFWGLWSRLFDDAGCLKDDIDPNVVLFLRTLLYVGKNLKSECSPRYLYETIGEFYAIEAGLPPPSQVWDSDGSDVSGFSLGHLSDLAEPRSHQPVLFRRTDGTDTELLDAIQRLADKVSTSLGWFDPSQLTFRHGPGAVSDLPRDSYKYAFPSWSVRLESHFPYDLCGTTALGQGEFSTDYDRPKDSETHSELIAVPKSMKGPRLIAKEPTCHQWAQQGIRLWLEDRLNRTLIGTSINFRSQEVSQNLALQGSEDGSVATIDLKSASDRISCSVIQRIFRRNPILLGAMISCRTRYLRNTVDKTRDSLIKLRKFSTQGSALTFPVQSILFTIVAIAVGKQLEPRRSEESLARSVRVFGDDIIVPNHWEPHVRYALEILGLKVNTTKTFSRGNFREACGMDAFQGHDVTPPHILTAYVESDPGSLGSLVAVSNNFYKKGFWIASNWLASTIPHRIRRKIPVVSSSSGGFGFLSHVGSKVPPTLRRWNTYLHRWESRLVQVYARTTTKKQDHPAALLQWFTEAPPPWFDYESGVAVGGVPAIRHAWVPDEDLCIT